MHCGERVWKASGRESQIHSVLPGTANGTQSHHPSKRVTSRVLLATCTPPSMRLYACDLLPYQLLETDDPALYNSITTHDITGLDLVFADEERDKTTGKVTVSGKGEGGRAECDCGCFNMAGHTTEERRRGFGCH